MPVTGTQVIDRLDAIYGDTANAKWTAAQKLEFVNAAIDAAWTYGIKNIKRDSSKTLDSEIFEYTPTNAAELEDGYAAAYVVPQQTKSNLKVRLHRVYQWLNSTTWTVVVHPSIARAWDGKVLHLDYNARVARISAKGDNIELPFDYLWPSVALIACLSAMAKGEQFNAKPYELQVPVWKKMVEQNAMFSRRGLITKLPELYEEGRNSGINLETGRYAV